MGIAHIMTVKNTEKVQASNPRQSRNTHQFSTRRKKTAIVHAT